MIYQGKIVKSVIKSVENGSIKNNWESTPYNVLGMQYTTCVFAYHMKVCER